MKKIIFVLVIASIFSCLFFINPSSVSAADDDMSSWFGGSNSASSVDSADSGSVQLTDPITGKSGGSITSIDVAVTRIIKYVLGVIGVVALIAFIYGGIMWMTSMGDTNKIAKGKNIMIWAVMGLIVIFASYAIVNLLLGAFGVK
jgi:hypothetical protein